MADNSNFRILPIWDWYRNINNDISLHFRLFPRKSNDKTYQKIKKKIILGPTWAVLAQSWSKINFKRALPVFKYSNYLPSCQNSEKKLMSHPEKNAELMDRHTDGQIDGQH